VRFWNAGNGQAARTQTEPAAVTALAVSRDGARLAVGIADKSIKVYPTAGGNPLFTLVGHQAEIRALAFSPDNARLVSAAADNRAIVWEQTDGRLLEIVPVDGLTTAIYGATPGEIIAADAQGVTHVRPLRYAGALRGMAKPTTAVAFHPAGQLIVAACEDGTVRGCNLANFQQAFSANHGAPVRDLAMRGDGQMMASAGDDKLVKLWNPTNGAQAQPPQLAGFTNSVRGVAFAADGGRVVGVGGAQGGGAQGGGEVLVFNLTPPAGLLEQTLTGHAGIALDCAAIGAGGRFVSTAGDGPVLVWETLAVRHIPGHTQPVTSLAALPQLQAGQPPELLSGSLDGSLRRWNTLTGQALAQLNHGGPVTAVAVRGDGQRWASASGNNTLKLWNATNNQQLAEMRGDIRAQTLVARLTQEKNDATARLNDAKTAADAAEKDLPVKTDAEKKASEALAAADKDVEAKAAALTTVASTKADAEKLAIEAAAVAQKAAVAMAEANQLALEMMAKARLLAEKAEQARLVAADDAANAQLAKVHADAMALAAAADAQAKAAEAAKTAPAKTATDTAQSAATAAQKALDTGKPFNDAATALAQSQSAQRSAKQTHELAARESAVAAAAVPAAKDTLAKADATLKKSDVDLAAAVAAEQQAQLPVHTVAFSPDGRTLASGGEFGAVHTWDAETGKAVASYVGHAGPVRQAAYLSADALVSASADKQAIVWNLNPSWRLERVIGNIADPDTLVDRVAAVDFHPDGTLLAAAGGVPSRGGELKIFRVADGALVRAIADPHTDAVASVAFSPDGRFLASAAADKYVKKWDAAAGELRLQFEGHTNYVTGVAWRAGGKVLVSSGSDGTIRTWDAETGDRIRLIQGYNKQVSAVKFVGATQFIVSSAGDPLVRMHNTDNGGVQVNYGGTAEYMYAVDAAGDQTNGVVIAGGHDGVLRIWRANGPVLHAIAPPEPETTTEPTLAKP
jgi:WD40 repeat protein